MSTKCTLKIRTPNINLNLEGDAALVRAGYEGIRSELLRQLRAERIDTEQQPYAEPVVKARPKKQKRPFENQPEYVWVFKTNDLYHKVHVVERVKLHATGLGCYVQPGRLKRIYVESDYADLVGQLIPPGKTLWSELTRLGRERLRNE